MKVMVLGKATAQTEAGEMATAEEFVRLRAGRNRGSDARRAPRRQGVTSTTQQAISVV